MIRPQILTAAALLATLFHSASSVEVPRVPYDLLPEEMPQEAKERARQAAIRRARVWMDPEIAIEEADLRSGNDPYLGLADEITCDYVDTDLGGSVPKFLCSLSNGELIKVKFGKSDADSTREIPAEVAASRLLRVLGFGADRMYVVRRVHCRGCPASLKKAHRDGGNIDLEKRFKQRGRRARETGAGSGIEAFEWVSVERRMEGRRIQTSDDEGWSWRDDLPRVDTMLPDSSSRGELDAFRLLMSFIESVDSKASNQRLMCLPGGFSEAAPGECSRPFMMVHDLGATFGKPGALSVSRAKFRLGGWQSQEIWKEAGSCTTGSDHGMKYTFDAYPISEEGRQFLAGLMNRLSLRQIGDLFRGVRAGAYADGGAEDFEVDELIRASLTHHGATELLEAFDIGAVMNGPSRGGKREELTIADVEDARLKAELTALAWTTVFESKRAAINNRTCTPRARG